ncbi:ROK family protein [Schlesneria paludicola]|uniref:ROK family protein n=1 Tax=Schlesneria paludicola TaxID=360056 RepID=UPI00029B1705|nr:ROK family protein [Schlesneria paludicola]
MFLGIEIGGTKLQLGVGRGDGSDFVAFERLDVNPAAGGQGIRDQIKEVGRKLVAAHSVQRAAYGFGGPIFGSRGIVQTSHQIAGWDQFPLSQWTEQELGVPTKLGNDCDVAALAEASFGAGRDAHSVFYVTVGTGIGGGLVFNRKIHGTDRPASAEIGHLRPGLDATSYKQTIESHAAGPGIAHATRIRLESMRQAGEATRDLHDFRERCGGNFEQLTTKAIGEAAAAGNQLAREQYVAATRVLGWGIAQMITLLAPEVVVVGGGVSLVGEEIFFAPLRAAVQQYVFPPLKDSYRLVPAELGESVVVHGALALARSE